MKNIVLLSILLLCGCMNVTERQHWENMAQAAMDDAVEIESKGHLWLVSYSGTNASSICHHPDCPCQEKEENAK